VQSARAVIVVAAFVTAAVVSLLMETAWLGALAAAVVFLTPAVVDIHLSVLSEPLFIALLVSALALMVRAGKDDAWWVRAALGVVAAAALMVRYVGGGVVAAAAIWVIARRAPWRQRVRDLVIVCLPAVVMTGLWVAHTTHVAGATGIRRFALYHHLGATLRVGGSTVGDWLTPGVAGPLWLRWVLAIVVGVAAINVVRRGTMRAAWLLILALGLVVLVSRLIADPNIPFDERILAPVFVLAEIATVAMVRTAPFVARVILGAWLIASGVVSVIAVVGALEDGNDFASADWRFSPTVAWVRDSAAGRTIYSNWPVALYFHAGRDAHSLPPVLEPLTLRRFGDRLARTHGLLVAFDTPSPDAAPPDSIAARLRLQAVARLSDGTVWELP
jgi:4-amino-4-deoxy-L-arabinose transferase-like glycosyltransferase